MEVILKEDIEKLGEKDELVTVKPGYGRNFLIPQGKAILATASVKKMHEETLRQRSHKAAKVLEEAKAAAEKFNLYRSFFSQLGRAVTNKFQYPQVDRVERSLDVDHRAGTYISVSVSTGGSS